MMITAIDGVEGRAVADYLVIVSGEAVKGTTPSGDTFAGITGLVGGRVAQGEGRGHRTDEQRRKRTRSRCLRQC